MLMPPTNATLKCDNHDVHTEDGMRRLQMDNLTAVPGDVGRYRN